MSAARSCRPSAASSRSFASPKKRRPPGVSDSPCACWRTKSWMPNSASSWAIAAEIDGEETLTASEAAAMLPAWPTATKYSSWRRVKRSGMARECRPSPARASAAIRRRHAVARGGGRVERAGDVGVELRGGRAPRARRARRPGRPRSSRRGGRRPARATSRTSFRPAEWIGPASPPASRPARIAASRRSPRWPVAAEEAVDDGPGHAVVGEQVAAAGDVVVARLGPDAERVRRRNGWRCCRRASTARTWR